MSCNTPRSLGRAGGTAGAVVAAMMHDTSDGKTVLVTMHEDLERLSNAVDSGCGENPVATELAWARIKARVLEDSTERVQMALALASLATALGTRLDPNATDAECVRACVTAAEINAQAKRTIETIGQAAHAQQSAVIIEPIARNGVDAFLVKMALREAFFPRHPCSTPWPSSPGRWPSSPGRWRSDY